MNKMTFFKLISALASQAEAADYFLDAIADNRKAEMPDEKTDKRVEKILNVGIVFFSAMIVIRTLSVITTTVVLLKDNPKIEDDTTE